MAGTGLESLTAIGSLFFVIILLVFAVLGFLMPYFVYRISCKTTDILNTLHDISESLGKNPDVIECSSCEFGFSKKTFLDSMGICPNCNQKMA
jgi:hypothetical protein